MTNKTDTLSRLREVMGADTFTELLVERARALDPEAWEAQADLEERGELNDPDLDEAVNDTFQQAEEQLLEQVLQETLVEQARNHCEDCFTN
jgi:hypothetical protein